MVRCGVSNMLERTAMVLYPFCSVNSLPFCICGVRTQIQKGNFDTDTDTEGKF